MGPSAAPLLRRTGVARRSVKPQRCSVCSAGRAALPKRSRPLAAEHSARAARPAREGTGTGRDETHLDRFEPFSPLSGLSKHPMSKAARTRSA